MCFLSSLSIRSWGPGSGISINLRFSNRVELPSMIFIWRDEVCDLELALGLKFMNSLFEHAVSLGQALMLTQMFEPRIHYKHLKPVTFFCSVFKNSSLICSCTFALARQPVYCFENLRLIFTLNSIFCCDQYGPAVLVNFC